MCSECREVSRAKRGKRPPFDRGSIDTGNQRGERSKDNGCTQRSHTLASAPWEQCRRGMARSLSSDGGRCGSLEPRRARVPSEREAKSLAARRRVRTRRPCRIDGERRWARCGLGGCRDRVGVCRCPHAGAYAKTQLIGRREGPGSFRTQSLGSAFGRAEVGAAVSRERCGMAARGIGRSKRPRSSNRHPIKTVVRARGRHAA